MSLNWNITEVKNRKQKLRSKKNQQILNVLIFATMGIGIRKITKRNYKKFYVRITAFEHIRGAFLYKGNKPYYITLEDIENFIGLVTNANEMSASQFESLLAR